MQSFHKKLSATAAAAALLAVLGVAFAQSSDNSTTTDRSTADLQSPIGAPTSSHATDPAKDKLSTTGTLRPTTGTSNTTGTMSSTDNATASSSDNASTTSSGTDNTAAATTDNSAATPAPRADRN